jgi:thioredoxin-like negative regulator of GroEL
LKWVNQITDPKLRKAAESHVWSMERDSLRQEAGKDPAGIMQSIIAGQSKYGDYWLEEAMSTWVAKDSDKAQEWYQKNWNSMPANKSQYLAAAFAKQAASQGDMAAAREWAAHIQDPKTKQRIEAGIAKAEGNKGK